MIPHAQTTNVLVFCFDAFSSREPVSTSLENALDIARLFPDQASAPSRFEQIAPLGVFFVEMLGIDHAVGSKAAEILAQFAPCRENPHRFVIADRNWPDRAFAVAAVFVAVAQRDFLALVNLRPGPRHVDAVGLPAPVRTGAAGGLEHKRS